MTSDNSVCHLPPHTPRPLHIEEPPDICDILRRPCLLCDPPARPQRRWPSCWNGEEDVPRGPKQATPSYLDTPSYTGTNTHPLWRQQLLHSPWIVSKDLWPWNVGGIPMEEPNNNELWELSPTSTITNTTTTSTTHKVSPAIRTTSPLPSSPTQALLSVTPPSSPSLQLQAPNQRSQSTSSSSRASSPPSPPFLRLPPSRTLPAHNSRPTLDTSATRNGTMASPLPPYQQPPASSTPSALPSPWTGRPASPTIAPPPQLSQHPKVAFQAFSPSHNPEAPSLLPVHNTAMSSFFPSARSSRHSSFANNDAQRPVFGPNGGGSSFSSVSSTSSISSSSSFSSVARSGSFSAGAPSTNANNNREDYAAGAALFNQSSTAASTPNATTARPAFMTSPTPHSASFRRASSIELDHGQPHQGHQGLFALSASVTSQRFSPLVGSSASSITVGPPTGSPYAAPIPSSDIPTASSSSVLDRFANLAQVTRDAELISHGMKQLELNADATPLTTPPHHSNHQSRHGSVSSNFFPSPSMSEFSPFVSPVISNAISRSNSVTASNMWQTPVSSGSVSTVVSPSGNTVQLHRDQSTEPFGNMSPAMGSTNSPLFEPPGSRGPFHPHYASVFSSPANSVSGLSDNWPSTTQADEFAYKSPSATPLSLAGQKGTPPARPLSRLSNAGGSINGDRNLRQQLAHQQQAQAQSRPQPQQTPPPATPSFRFNNNNSFHPATPSETPHRGGNNNNNNSNRKNHADYSASMRSPLLEEFRGNKNKKYDIKDIYGHVVEFSGDQYGSRFIQQRLESASSEEKQVIFEELRSNSLQLMTDVFGNYVIQKFFELGNQTQKTIMAKQMEGNILTLSIQMYGCRVVQKAIEHILTDQQATLIKELDGYVLQCVKDQNGNHVVQKAIERIPAEHIGFIIDAFHGQVFSLATHPYGCRVIQRMLEHCEEDARNSILAEIHSVTFHLVEDQYGNYVIQHVIDHGSPADREQVMEIVRSSILVFSRHKFASNVVEKCIIRGSSLQRDLLIEEILRPHANDGVVPLNVMMKDQFANYVIQKLLDVTKGDQHDRLVEAIKPHLTQLKKFTYGKHLASIEKLIQQESKSS